MNPIGGYFEFELRRCEEYHQQAIRLNTGRNALELVLRSKKYSKIFIPYYTCNAILEPFKKLGMKYEFYSIDKNFEPLIDWGLIKNDVGFLYTNYFGLKDVFIGKLAKVCKNLIVDNAQAFYSKPVANVPTFYSCRKFFGVPDGAYLFLNGILNIDLPIDHSENRSEHLLERIEHGPEAGYGSFKKNELGFINQPIMKMSKLTQALLASIDYQSVQEKRKENYGVLQEQLAEYNQMKINPDDACTPMNYLFLSKSPDLRQKLIDRKIFVASYWPNVLEWAIEGSLEHQYVSNLIPLPIDQRYGREDMLRMAKEIKNEYKN